MGILTWQNVPVPQIDSSAGLRTASDLFGRAAEAAKDAAAQDQAMQDEQKKYQQDQADRALMTDILSIQDLDVYNQRKAAGTLLDKRLAQYASPEMLAAMDNRQDTLLQRGDAQYKSDYGKDSAVRQQALAPIAAEARRIGVKDRVGAMEWLQGQEAFRNARTEDQDALIKSVYDAYQAPKDMTEAYRLRLLLQDRADADDAQKFLEEWQKKGKNPDEQIALYHGWKNRRGAMLARGLLTQRNEPIEAMLNSTPNYSGAEGELPYQLPAALQNLQTLHKRVTEGEYNRLGGEERIIINARGAAAGDRNAAVTSIIDTLRARSGKDGPPIDDGAVNRLLEKAEVFAKNHEVQVSPAELAGVLLSNLKDASLLSMKDIQDGKDLDEAGLEQSILRLKDARANLYGYDNSVIREQKFNNLTAKYQRAAQARQAAENKYNTNPETAKDTYVKALQAESKAAEMLDQFNKQTQAEADAAKKRADEKAAKEQKVVQERERLMQQENKRINSIRGGKR